MSKKNFSQSLGFSFIKFILRVVISITLIIIILSFAAVNGIELPSFFRSIGNNINVEKIKEGASNTFSNLKSEEQLKTINNEDSNNKNYEPLSFIGEKQLVLGELDSLGRATFAHIQLQDKDEPSSKREPRITYDPIGWHNYKFNYVTDTGDIKKAYLMNRGHLIGYQFSGLNSEPRNLVPQTRYLNAGSLSDTKIDSNNPNSQIFYEQLLDKWLAQNPDKWLDLRVIPLFHNEELIPRQVIMHWTGFDSNGQQIKITLSKHGKEKNSGLFTFVVLDNISPNATLNYLDGTATPKYK